MLRIAGITPESIVDGSGIRFTIFAQGCKHNCPSCHNPNTHSLDGGELIALEEIVEMIKEKGLLSGVTFSGGEPFLQAKEFAKLASLIKKLGRNLDIITYTGYLYEDLIKDNKKRVLLEASDILIDGLFEEEKQDLKLKYRGSSNQRIINVRESLKRDEIVIVN